MGAQAYHKIILFVGGISLALMVLADSHHRPSLRWRTIPQNKTEDWKSKFSVEERDALARPEGNNDRVKTYVRLAESRLKNARDLIAREQYSAAGEQVAAYTALIADAGEFTKIAVPKKDKAHKTLETNLREQLRTLDGIRRDATLTQAEIMEKAIKVVNQVRRQSLNLLLGADGGILSESDKQE